MSIFWLRSTTRRVWVSSPPRRTSLATGKSPAARVGGAAMAVRSAAEALPKSVAPKNVAPNGIATKKTAKLAARTAMGISSPCGPLILHYGGVVNRNLSGGGRKSPAQVPAQVPAKVPAQITGPSHWPMWRYRDGDGFYRRAPSQQYRRMAEQGLAEQGFEEI